MANLFAQTNNANWDSANMWNTVANGSGSFVTPGPADVCMANGKTVYVNLSSITVSELRNDTTGGATSGGQFQGRYSAGQQTINAHIYGGASNTACFYVDQLGSTYTNNLFITGNVYGPSGTSVAAVYFNVSNSTLRIDGNVTATAGNSCYGLHVGAGYNTTCTINGACVATGGSFCVRYESNYGNLTINGNVGGGTVGGGVIFYNYQASVSITGNITGSSTSSGFNGLNFTERGFDTLTINGNVTGGSTGAGIYGNATGWGVITITGTVTAGSGSPALSLQGTLDLTINGDLVNGTGAAAVYWYDSSSTVFNPNDLTKKLVINGNLNPINSGYYILDLTSSHMNITINSPTITGTSAGANPVVYISGPNNTVTINANLVGCSGTSSAAVVYVSARNSNVTINGNLTGPTASSGTPGTLSLVSGTGTVTVNGNITGSSSLVGGYGVKIWGSWAGRFIANGNVTGGARGHAIGLEVTGPLYIYINGTATSNEWPNYGLVSLAYAVYYNQNVMEGRTYIKDFAYNSAGIPPLNNVVRWFPYDIGTPTMKFYNSNLGTTQTLSAASARDYPAVTNVRKGVSYNYTKSVGTMEVPPAGSVALGIPVDNTVGTGVINPKSLKKASQHRSTV